MFLLHGSVVDCWSGSAAANESNDEQYRKSQFTITRKNNINQNTSIVKRLGAGVPVVELVKTDAASNLILSTKLNSYNERILSTEC